MLLLWAVVLVSSNVFSSSLGSCFSLEPISSLLSPLAVLKTDEGTGEMVGKNIAKALGPRFRFLVRGVESLGELRKWGCADQQAFVTLMSYRERSMSPKFRERKKKEEKKKEGRHDSVLIENNVEK